MKLTIFGTGYVGLVTAACFAEMGNTVTCVDIDSQRVSRLNNGECLIHEPGLKPILNDNLQSNRLHFTLNADSINQADAIFIAVGTPAREDGSADLTFVKNVANALGKNLERSTLIINKSTVPVGTADTVKQIINANLSDRGIKFTVDVASNPEFLKEGQAVNDFMKPDRIIAGASCSQSLALLRELYAPFNRNHNKLIEMDVRSAELTKYVANAMLATKISFMNEMSHLADRLGADIELVRQGIGSDPRIGYQFIYPGCGYGGSCFPKDVQALNHTANKCGLEAKILQATHAVNERQKNWMHEKISHYFEDNLCGKRFAVWGLAFKPNTDDVRDAPSLHLIQQLLNSGASVCAYDPKAISNTKRALGNVTELSFCDNPYDALHQADALVIMTERMEFRSPDFNLIENHLTQPVIFDGRNLFQLENVSRYGLQYISVGRTMKEKVEAEKV